MKSEYVRSINRIVDNRNAHLCSCKFPIEDKHGVYEGYRHHKNWELHKQDHSDPNFAHYLRCIGCGYELAKKYWNDSNGDAIDYINPEGSINHIDPDDIDDPDELKTYRVNATCETYLYIDVKASNSDEAVEIAKDTDGGSFTDTEEGDWIIDHVPELVEPRKVIRLTGHYDEVPIEDYKEVN
jgi:hypothetical protein